MDRFVGSDAVEVRAGLRLIEDIRTRLLAEAGLGPGGAVLELGCGAGEFLPRLAEAVGASGTVFGLDVSPGLCETARRAVAEHAGLARCEVLQGDMRALPLPSARVDAVVCRSVLQYAGEDLPRVGAEIARVLRGGGRVAAFEVLDGDAAPLLPVPRSAGHRRIHAEAGARWRRLPYAVSRAQLAEAFAPPEYSAVTVAAQVTDWVLPWARDRYLATLKQVPRPGCPTLEEVFTDGLDPADRGEWDALLDGATHMAQRGAFGYLMAVRAPAG